MLRGRTLTLFTLLAITATLPMACGKAPAAALPTAAPGLPTTPPTAAAATTALAPIDDSSADTSPEQPNDTTQGRLRVSNCVFNGPSVDMLLNGKLTVNGGVVQRDLGAPKTGGYQYLAPGTYSVAIVPTGQGIDKALLGPLDVTIVAGHRYTLVMLGQPDEQDRTPLVIDETAAYQAIGASPKDVTHITVNNIKGVPGIDFSLEDRVRDKNAPYGGYVAGIWPSGVFRKLAITVSGAPDQVIDAADLSAEQAGGFLGAGVDSLDCFAGTYPGAMGQDYNTETSAYTSLLSTLDFLQLQSDESTKNGGQTPAFITFLAALKAAGLTEELAQGGPYLLFAPTDAAFAALPKDKRDALLADPKALAGLINTHLITGYFPYGSMGPIGQGFSRTVTNMRGQQLKVTGNDSALRINGKLIGNTSSTFVANGTRVMSVPTLLLEEVK